jgi:hypothetical protein
MQYLKLITHTGNGLRASGSSILPKHPLRLASVRKEFSLVRTVFCDILLETA